jgi:FKBP-type peptidyl-prolyl cis-trans isomerase FklB
MKISKIVKGLFLSASAVLLFVGCDQMGGAKKSGVLSNELDSVSYAIGIDIAANLKKSGFEEINSDAIAKGFADIFAGTEPAIDPAAANKYVMDYFNKMRTMKGENNKKAAEEFLKENGTKDGVITTASGLQYKINQAGTGTIPTETDMVKVYYKGTLTDGREFDATTEGNPAQFRVNGVIRGWTEALMLMPVGSKWTIWVHPDLGYGTNPRQGGIIEANHLLVFELELLEIVQK